MNLREPSTKDSVDALRPKVLPAPRGLPRGWRITLAVVEPLSVVALFVFLLVKSWLRWPDPLVDFPRELYMAWRISEGDLLYEKIMNWYGPLPQLIQGAGFKIFGVGLDTMVWINIALTVGVLLLLRGIFSVLGNRLMVWLASVVFLAVFAFGYYDLTGSNFTFIAPYVSEATYGFAGLLLVIWGLLRHLRSQHSRWLAVSGLGFAITYLDKPEPVLAATGALAIYLLAQILQQTRSVVNSQQTSWINACGKAAHQLGWLALGFLALVLPVFIFFWTQGGFGYALRATNWVARSGLDPAARQVMENSSFMRKVIGFDYPLENFIFQVGAGGALLLVCLVLVLATRSWALARKFSPRWWISLFAAIAAVGLGEWLGWSANEWSGIGRAIVFPVWLAATAYVVRGLRLATRRSAASGRVLGVAVLGVAASLMLVRMILNGHLDAYGFVMMPLAVLFGIHLMVVEAARATPDRGGKLLAALFTLLTLSAAAVLLNFNLGVYAKKTYVAGMGRDRFYAYPPELNSQGLMLNAMIAAVKQDTPNAKTLVAFPHGIAVNYHCRIPTSLAELEFTPVALGFAGPQHVVDELKSHPPDAAILFAADYRVFTLQYFGQDVGSGSDIIRFLNDQYRVIARGAASPDSASGHQVDLMVFKPANGQSGETLLPVTK